MKKLLKIYKMLFRLLRLKSEQKKKIERIATAHFRTALNNIYNEFFEVKHRLDDYEKVSKHYGIENPLQLLKILEGIPNTNLTATRTEHMFIKEFLEAEYKRSIEKNEFTEVTNLIPKEN